MVREIARQTCRSGKHAARRGKTRRRRHRLLPGARAEVGRSRGVRLRVLSPHACHADCYRLPDRQVRRALAQLTVDHVILIQPSLATSSGRTTLLREKVHRPNIMASSNRCMVRLSNSKLPGAGSADHWAITSTRSPFGDVKSMTTPGP